jgi:PAS domain S-box-containing protein
MSESDEKLGEVMDKNSTNSEDFLVLSIDQNGRIRYFNKECEKIVGYVKDEISDKQFFDYLIPDKYREQWEKLVDSVKQNKSTNEFVLPWLTKDGQEVMVSWNIAPVDDIDGTSGDIGLVGKLFKLEETGEDRSEFKRNEEDNVEFSLGRKKFVFRKKHDSISDVASAKGKNNNSKKQQKSADKPIKIDKESKEESGSNEKEESSQVIKGEEEDIADDSPDLFEKYSPDNLAKKFRELDDTLRSLEELKEKNKELERENNNLRKALEEANKKSSKNGRDLSDERGLFGKLKKKKKLTRLMEELDEREKKLEELENQLNEDKKEINKRRNQFVNWREKLEQLEMEIETRREDLIKEEEIFKEKMLSSLDGNVREEFCNLNELSSYSETEFNEIKKENYDFLDRTSDSAAIVQRGILKKINEPFAKLLGYSEKDLIDRSLLDFVAPEGFSAIEDYYLDRLKGGEVTRYETVFLTKDDKALPVELVYRPSSFDDMKADLIIVNIRSEKDIKNG